MRFVCDTNKAQLTTISSPRENTISIKIFPHIICGSVLIFYVSHYFLCLSASVSVSLRPLAKVGRHALLSDDWFLSFFLSFFLTVVHLLSFFSIGKDLLTKIRHFEFSLSFSLFVSLHSFVSSSFFSDSKGDFFFLLHLSNEHFYSYTFINVIIPIKAYSYYSKEIK